MSCVLGCSSANFNPGEDEKQVDITVQTINSFVVFGQITDCAKKNKPVIGALVKAFRCVDKKLIPVCHTFTGCNGFYMLNLIDIKPGEKIIVMATCGCLSSHLCIKCHHDCDCHHKCSDERDE